MTDLLLGSESYRSDDDKDTFNFPSELDMSQDRLAVSQKRDNTQRHMKSADR